MVRVKYVNDFSFKQIDQYRQYFIDTINGKNFFVKKYFDRSLKDAEEEFLIAKKLYVKFKNNPKIRPVKPEKYDKKNNEIFFEYIDDPITYRALSLNKEFVPSKKDFVLFGKTLAKYHQCLNKSMKNNNHVGVTLGDFSLNNILVTKKGSFVVIDFGMPNHIKSRIKNISDDLAEFIISLFSYPLFKHNRYLFKHAENFMYHFLSGYNSELKKPLDLVELFRSIDRVLNDFYLEERWYVKLSVRLIRILIKRKFSYIYNCLKDDYDYRHDFSTDVRVKTYDADYDKENKFYSFTWNYIEKNLLLKALSNAKSPYLDFACGSGRVLVDAEKLFEESYGVDVSKKMLSLAASRVNSSKLCAVDITKEKSSFIPSKFSAITAMRFYFTANDSLRNESTFHLSQLLDKDGLFVFNNHGNKYSFFLFYRIFHKLKGRNFRSNTMLSNRDVYKLMKRYNLKIIKREGYAFFPNLVYRLLGKQLYVKIDRIISKTFLSRFSIQQLYICKPAS